MRLATRTNYGGRILLAAGVAFTLAALPASAAVDDFTGYDGTLAGKEGGAASGGINWTGAWWAHAADVDGGDADAAIINESLGEAGGATSVSPIVASDVMSTVRGFTAQDSGTVWLSALVRVSETLDQGAGYGGIAIYQDSNLIVQLGRGWGAANWGIYRESDGQMSHSGHVITANQAVRLVAKLDLDAADGENVLLWVNPDLTQTEAANEVSAGIQATLETIDVVRLRTNYTTATWSFDNLEVTTTSPFVPEPGAALGLGGLAGFSLLRRRNRRAGV